MTICRERSVPSLRSFRPARTRNRPPYLAKGWRWRRDRPCRLPRRRRRRARSNSPWPFQACERHLELGRALAQRPGGPIRLGMEIAPRRAGAGLGIGDFDARNDITFGIGLRSFGAARLAARVGVKSKRRGDLGDDPLRGGPGIAAASPGDRRRVVGAGADRLGRRRDALLVADEAPAGRMPGVTRSMSASRRRAQHRRLRGARRRARRAGRSRLRGAARDQRQDAQGVAGLGESASSQEVRTVTPSSLQARALARRAARRASSADRRGR